MNRILLLLLLFITQLAQNCCGQEKPTSIDKTLEWFESNEINHPSSNLFLHCDKTLYTNSETIWFAAYLTNNRGTPIALHNTLSVALFNEESKTINLSELYAMENGLASGSIRLPDSIPPGNYRLFAYTNIVDGNGRPIELFSQLLTIKSTLDSKFTASVKLLDTAKIFSGDRRVSIRVGGLPIDRKGNYLPATISYQIAGGTKQSAQTDGQGEATIPIPADSDVKPLHNNLTASISFEKDLLHLQLALPVSDPKFVNIKFYPEGGQMVNGIATLVGLEAKTDFGQPVAIRTVLQENGKPIDTIETSASGMGSFKVQPKPNSNYQLKAFKSNVLLKDTLYSLPKAIDGFPSISMANAIATDTLSFTVRSVKTMLYDIVLYNTHQLLASFKLMVNANGGRVKIDLKDFPKGIASVTVLDTLGNPLAERLFFAHYTDKDLLSATTDKPIYRTREKVGLKLSLLPQVDGKEESAIVSVSVVQGNRIEVSKFRDMESYTYLEHELGNLPQSAMETPYRNKVYLEQLLLIKGWRRFVWEPKNWPTRIDIANRYQSLELSGTVRKNDKLLKKSVSLTLLRDNRVDIVSTDAKGKIAITHQLLLVTAGKPLIFFLNEKNKFPYSIAFNNPYLIKNNAQVNKSFDNMISGSIISNSKELTYRGNDKSIQLKTVDITKRKNDFLTGSSGPNECGDWVCVYNILNCLNHGPNFYGSRPPIKGELYRSNMSGASQTLYTGCSIGGQGVFHYNGIQVAREFYVNDYTSKDLLTDYQSTVYWQPFVVLNSTKDTELNFFTSDLKAPYRIIVQGISEKQIVTGASTLRVE